MLQSLWLMITIDNWGKNNYWGCCCFEMVWRMAGRESPKPHKPRDLVVRLCYGSQPGMDWDLGNNFNMYDFWRNYARNGQTHLDERETLVGKPTLA
jgi:hypothetical protein